MQSFTPGPELSQPAGTRLFVLTTDEPDDGPLGRIGPIAAVYALRPGETPFRFEAGDPLPTDPRADLVVEGRPVLLPTGAGTWRLYTGVPPAVDVVALRCPS